ncbi:hypothetical protein MU859_03640 [Lactobacillus kefiranofaciens subsp. kefirgranum]|uniref:Transposase n=1 Tax=Lactobacillus kefiranofaciens TaxID=267818 RepID=A0AAX3UF77_9LACO|nr:transposase [Lactobacillus kefiranofaciens]AEG40289.1 Transposase [Lactobacillus kefiranofaciens subsp. kefiranofaciens]MCJ2171306.1 hypothetical protein [Lactobacillus kefiranofaciens]URW72005.1 hypothetical protein MU859_03640 [Lactobacillus kefiranofaciens subsp. kefirgranum]URW73935.1 hypothetical protein MU860_03520 [Lactobacillus kefiranofaciens subsp. kefirgranum]WGO86385.1 hypothetical protein QEJ78_02630 [Lactobacillus kefiranofaciens]
MVKEYHTSSSVSVLIYHLVWVTKYRNHCKAIFGYSKKSNKFLVHDPLYQANKFYRGGGGRNAYDLGPISWVKASHINREFAYRGGNNALTTD